MRSSFGPAQKQSLAKQSMASSNGDYKQYSYSNLYKLLPLYYKRFVILLLFFMPNMTNGMMWVTCSPITSTLQKIYQVDELTVNLASLCFMILYVFINFPANYVLDDFGLKIGIFIGTATTIVGAWIRLLVNQNFWFIILGQLLASIGQPFLLNSPTKIATVWFIPEHRPMAVAVLALINGVGVGVGFLIPGLIINGNDEGDKAKDQVFFLMLVEAIIVSVLCFPVFIFYKEKPPTPPSVAAETQKTSFKVSVPQLLKNKNFLVLLFAFSCILGNFNALATLINQYIVPFNFDDNQSSVFGALFIICGLTGAGFASVYVEKTLKYKQILLFGAIIGIVAYFFFSIILYEENFLYQLFAIVLLGFCTTPMLPLSLDLGCELTFPIGEALSTGILMTGGQIVGVIQIISVDQFIGTTTKNEVLHANIIAGSIIICGSVAYFFLKQELKRNINEVQQKLDKLNDPLIQNPTLVYQQSDCIVENNK